ncbi:MAG: alanyl-tRNA editing protein [Lachnospiraceae bacterium]|nr:alanyl-tRNA editing protein [Lachnospiraceae bacterium]
MITESLFYIDAYMRSFTETVISCRKGKKGYEVVLSATAFYPEGGGQPYDLGTLRLLNTFAVSKSENEEVSAFEVTQRENFAGEVSQTAANILEVHEKSGELVHYTDGPLPEGAQVYGEIDWNRRFDLMQQHSGEHIVSGLVHAAYGYDNVGFHMGSDVITIDFNGELDEAALQEIATQANEAIWQNQKPHIFYPSPEELKTLPYRSKKELTGEVRIVEFPAAPPHAERTGMGGANMPLSSSEVASPAAPSCAKPFIDMCACCGLHVAYAGEIGIVKLLSVEKCREGVRVEMIRGTRVLDFMNMVNAQNHQVSVLLSAKPDRTADAVKRSLDENYRLKGRVLAMEEKLFAQEAEHLEGAGDVLLFEKDMDADSVRKLAVAVMETCGGRCAVFSDNGDGSFKYAIGERDGDLRELIRSMHKAL